VRTLASLSGRSHDIWLPSIFSQFAVCRPLSLPLGPETRTEDRSFLAEFENCPEEISDRGRIPFQQFRFGPKILIGRKRGSVTAAKKIIVYLKEK
jgi:hypothetical protein